MIKYTPWCVYENAGGKGAITRFRSLPDGAVRRSIADTPARSPRTDGDTDTEAYGKPSLGRQSGTPRRRLSSWPGPRSARLTATRPLTK